MPESPYLQAKLIIPSKPAHLSSVRDLIESAAGQTELAANEVQRVVTAAFEAVVNAATHGSPQGPGSTIAVDVYVYQDRLVIEVLDHGHGIECPKSSKMPDTEATRGRGIPLMRALVDKVEFSKSDVGRVTLIKYMKNRVDLA